MSKIVVLPKNIAELIAAGEVVERPASVVKELCENALDAGADRIIVELQRGGLGLIRVTDNGSGIAREDVRNAFLRNATSKVRSVEELYAIATLGFRGEALASIAAMARVELLTRTAGEVAGTRYLIEGGEETSLEDAGCPTGTTILVRDLFFNTPARQKFMKSNRTEGAAASVVVEKLALSHPEVSFRLIRDGAEDFSTPGDGDTVNCVRRVLGREYADALLPVTLEEPPYSVTGCVSRPESARGTRTGQNVFINGRYVRSKTVTAALEEAYSGHVMVGRYPACILYLTMPFSAIDVNVHPSKLEIRFSQEKPVYDLVYGAVRTALEQNRSYPKLVRPTPAQKYAAALRLQQSLPPEEAAGLIASQMGRQEQLRLNTGAQHPASYRPGSSSVRTDRSPDLSSGSSPAGKTGGGRPSGASVPAPGEDSPRQAFSATARTSGPDNRPESPAPGEAPPQNLSGPEEAGYTCPDRNAGFIEDPALPIDRSRYLIPQADAAKTGETPGRSEEPSVPVSDTPDAAPEIAPSLSCGLPEEMSASNAVCSAPLSVPSDPAWEVPPIPETEDLPAVRLLGEVFHTYMLAESGNSLLLVDKHAAHERLLYEQLKAEDMRSCRQVLLSPVMLKCTRADYALLTENLDTLEQLGFLVEDFGGQTLLIREVPAVLADGDAGEMILEIAGKLRSGNRSLMPERLDEILHSIACRAAVKANDQSLLPELQRLMERLLAHPELRNCPHGRPVYLEITRHELEKQFGRLG